MTKLKSFIVLALLMAAGYAAAQTAWTPLSYQHLETSSTLALSAPVTAAQRGIARIVADVDVWVAVSGPFTTTATSIPIFLPASQAGYIRLPAGQGSGKTDGRRVIIFHSTLTGDIHITEVE